MMSGKYRQNKVMIILQDGYSLCIFQRQLQTNRLIAVDLIKQKALDADPRAIY